MCAKDRASKSVQRYATRFTFISRISSRRIFTSSCKANRNSSSASCHAWTSPSAAPPLPVLRQSLDILATAQLPAAGLLRAGAHLAGDASHSFSMTGTHAVPSFRRRPKEAARVHPRPHRQAVKRRTARRRRKEQACLSEASSCSLAFGLPGVGLTVLPADFLLGIFSFRLNERRSTVSCTSHAGTHLAGDASHSFSMTGTHAVLYFRRRPKEAARAQPRPHRQAVKRRAARRR